MLSKEELDAMIRENPFCVINDILYKALYDDIIHLRIQPGEKLSESKIAQTLQISRTPVRNALISLANDNLIERRNGRAAPCRRRKANGCMKRASPWKGTRPSWPRSGYPLMT